MPRPIRATSRAPGTRLARVCSPRGPSRKDKLPTWTPRPGEPTPIFPKAPRCGQEQRSLSTVTPRVQNFQVQKLKGRQRRRRRSLFVFIEYCRGTQGARC